MRPGDSKVHAIAVTPTDAALGGSFLSLSPERVLDAVEQAGHRTTGLCYALNSLENRVYEVELEDGRRLVGKFYRPGRWLRETILDEHALLRVLVENEIPAVAPEPFVDGETLHATQEGIWFALFPRVGGRNPDELSLEEYREVGRLLGRMHNVAAKQALVHRPEITPVSYGAGGLAVLQAKAALPDGVGARLQDAVARLVEVAARRFERVELLPVHGDCHRGNLLRGRDGFFFLDFDDMGWGPAAQDLWLLLPGRRADSEREIDALLEGYEVFRAFDRATLRLVEILRALRYVRYAAWIANRWDDASFTRAFPDWGSERYWQGLLQDLYEQLQLIDEEDRGYP